jgi:hypothetical protein
MSVTKRLRLPPFGKALQARGPGLVFVVPNTPAGWRIAKMCESGEVLIYQPGHDPATYHWPVCGCEIVLFTEALDARATDRMVHVLESAGASVVSCHARQGGTARFTA